MSDFDAFEKFFRRAMDKSRISVEDDKRLYKMAIDTTIIPAFVLRLIYFLWLECRKETL